MMGALHIGRGREGDGLPYIRVTRAHTIPLIWENRPLPSPGPGSMPTGSSRAMNDPVTRLERARAVRLLAVIGRAHTDPAVRWAGNQVMRYLRGAGDFESVLGIKGPPGSRTTVAVLLKRDDAARKLAALVERSGSAAEAGRRLAEDAPTYARTDGLVEELRAKGLSLSRSAMSRLLANRRDVSGDDEAESG